ncbi:MAG: hypothetical protein ABIQ32_04440 [Sphingomicrobium sp.]
MRLYLLFVTAATLASCNNAPPQDCAVATKQVLSCFDKYRGASDRELSLSCLPYSPPTRIAGAWVVGFETNMFFEGVEASPKLLTATNSPDALQQAGVHLPNDGELRVLKVDLIGRRSKCRIGWQRDIITDRIISARIVATSH